MVSTFCNDIFSLGAIVLSSKYNLFLTFVYQCLEKSLLFLSISLMNLLLSEVFMRLQEYYLAYLVKLCSILDGCGWPFNLGLCFLNLLNYLRHRLFQLLFFLQVNNTFCFSWLSILEQLFFNYFTSCGNINIHHIHIRNECLCFSKRLNLC